MAAGLRGQRLGESAFPGEKPAGAGGGCGCTSALGRVGEEEAAGPPGAEVVAGDVLAVAPVQHQPVAVLLGLRAGSAVSSYAAALAAARRQQKGANRGGTGIRTERTVSSPQAAGGLCRAAAGCAGAGTAGRRDSVKGWSALGQVRRSDCASRSWPSPYRTDPPCALLYTVS